eukprot:GHVR01047343.1.p1 GENE.GHVR01047343.1~~GHVR01047343.1.p1  ORF type:complete len:196 (+),score=64.33 GHVR01047343.1:32-589(+)
MTNKKEDKHRRSGRLAHTETSSELEQQRKTLQQIDGLLGRYTSGSSSSDGSHRDKTRKKKKNKINNNNNNNKNILDDENDNIIRIKNINNINKYKDTKNINNINKNIKKRRHDRITYTQIMIDDSKDQTQIHSWESMSAPSGRSPPLLFCSICSLKGIYKCVKCRDRYCSLECLRMHQSIKCRPD